MRSTASSIDSPVVPSSTASADTLHKQNIARVQLTIHAARAQVLDAAYAATPERFVRRPPRPPALPTETT